MAGIGDHIHVKKNTAGSSNELSFDVLDAARNDLDTKGRKAPRPQALQKPSKGDYHGVAEKATLSKPAKTEKRKAEGGRRVLPVVLAIVAGVLVVGGIAFLVTRFGPSYVHETQKFDEEFDAIVDNLIEIDAFMAKVDDVMEDPLSDEVKASSETLLKQIDTFKAAIEGLRADVAHSLESTYSEDKRQALQEVDSAAEARYSMLTAAGGAIKEASKVDAEVEAANKAWASVLEADRAARDATQRANMAYTEEETRAARDQTQDALDQFNSSLAEMQAIVDRHVGINLGNQMAYLNARVEALQHAVKTGDALLAMDRETAQAENDAYNEADARAAELAESLPPTVEDAIRSSYDETIAVYVAKYQSSRDQAISSDAYVRSYMNEARLVEGASKGAGN